MELNILIWNLQDFFIFLDKHKDENVLELTEPKWQLLTTSFKSNKELSKVKAIAELIKKISPDVLLFTEVGGKESIENFVTHFFNGEYDFIHYDSNSDRGIDLAGMIKKPLKVKSKFHSQKVFARGVLEIQLKISTRKLNIFHTHLKSKLNMSGTDFEGRSQREKEVKEIINIIHKKDRDMVMLTGDLNGVIYKDQSEPELALFNKELSLIDTFEHLDFLPHDRWTYQYFNKQQNPFYMQLDYALINPALREHFTLSESKVLDFEGNLRTNHALSLAEKRSYPSDHYPILIKIQD